MTEDELQSAVIDLARLGGWLVHHTRPARTTNGWRTPVQGDVGFPDLILAHPRYGIIFAELKSETGRLRKEQWRWFDAIQGVESERVQACVWRPADWRNIVEALTPGARVV